MADSAIAVSALIATGGVGLITLRWATTAGSCLGYMALDKFEVWASATNNRGAATKIGEDGSVSFVHAGLAMPTTRYYWVRARDLSGNLGDFFPLSATAGIVGTTSDVPLDPLREEFDTAITTEQTERIDADGALASLITSVIASFNDISASANFRARAIAGPAGYAVTIVLEARIGGAGAYTAGVYIDVSSTIGSRLRLKSGRTVIEDDLGNILALFTNGKLAVGRLDAGIINASALFLNGVVVTAAIANFAVSSPVVFSNSSGINVSNGQGNVQVAAAVKTPVNPLGRIEVTFTASVYAMFNNFANWGSFLGTLYRNGVPVGNCIARPDDENQDGLLVIRYIDTAPGAAAATWAVHVQYISSPGPGSNIGCRNRYLSVVDHAK